MTEQTDEKKEEKGIMLKGISIRESVFLLNNFPHCSALICVPEVHFMLCFILLLCKYSTRPQMHLVIFNGSGVVCNTHPRGRMNLEC